MRKYLVLCLLFLALLLVGCTQTQTQTGTPKYGAYQSTIKKEVMSIPKGELTKTEKNDILYIREEEKLARDVYLTLYKVWNLKIFSNIAKSEQIHMDLMKLLIEKYGLEDPVDDHGIGVFTNSELGKLYKELVKTGNKSIVDALKVGAMIEELDIHDLQRAINSTKKEDLKIVYSNLMKGSRNHLRAFVSQLSNYGAKYVPKYISIEEFNKIVSSPMEKGRS